MQEEMLEQDRENQASGVFYNKPMLEKLTEHYLRNIRQGNGGHMVAYHCDLNEKVASEYSYPSGKFTLKSVENRFFLWHYDPFRA